MTKDRADTVKIAGFWLELKSSWEKWQQGQPMPSLQEATQAYFEDVSFACMNSALKALGSVYENVPPMRDGKEAWSHVFHYLVEERPRAALRVIDDIFLRARANANTPEGLAPLDELAYQLGWILNQFQMRMRDVARDYAGEHGTPTQAGVTGTIHKPVGDKESQVTLLDIMAFMDPNWATATEREELRTLSSAVVEAFFPGVRTAFKLRLYLRLLRENRNVIISVANQIVLALAGVGKAVFADGASVVMNALTARTAEEPAFQELDREAQMYFLGYTALSLSDRTEIWTHLGECMREFLAENEKAPPEKRTPANIIIERMEAFAALLLNELRGKDALLSENELDPLFTAIATARQQHCP